MSTIPGYWRFKKLKSQLKNNYVKNIIKNKNYRPENNHYIFADPRGGSTWLKEIVQEITQEPVIWEPLHVGIKNSPFKKINFDWRQHIPEREEWPEAKELFDLLFTGKILNNGIFYHSTLKQCKNSDSLLYKICRGSALIPWLTKKYDFKYKPIHLIRHPFAVIASQLRHGGWDYSYDGFNIPNTPFNNHYVEHSAFLKSLKTNEEAMTAVWCLSNLPTINNERSNKDWLTINYEELIINPEKTIETILSAWNVDYDLSKLNFSKNSKTTKEDSPDSVKKRISHWQNSLTEKQIDDMGKVLDYFSIKCYSKNDPFPVKIFNYDYEK